MLDRSRALRLVPVLGLAVLSACAAPSSFDGLTGGTPKPENELRTRASDPTMDAPRPLSPLSVSWVATTRPTFKWKQSAGSTGAILELCRTRACDGDDVRRIDVEGETITVNEDLEPGVWFWRLFGTSKERAGTKASPTWEVVVRGNGSKAVSDVPSGSVVDVDGDGLPDLVVTSDTYDFDENDELGVFPDINVWFGGKDGKLHPKDFGVTEIFAEAGDDQVAALDTDGDGFTDVARSVQIRGIGEHHVSIHFGGPGKAWQVDDMGGWDFFDFDKNAMIALPGNAGIPGVREGGDVNGDGYGDILCAATNLSIVGLGGAKGPSTSMPLLLASPTSKMSTLLVGAFDADGDGLSDMVFPSPRAGAIAAARGDRERVQVTADLMPQDVGVAEKAVAFTSGDFDGDGIADIAATVPIDGRRNVCIWLGNRNKDRLFEAKHCVYGPVDDPSYGANLSTGDLTAKGRDDILVSGGEGERGYVEIIGVEGEGLMIDRIDLTGIGGKLTTIWPGRPGKARWATVDAAGTAIMVFEGRTLSQSITTVGRSGDFMKKVRSIR